MKLALKLAWEYRYSWLAMFLLTAASSLVMVVSSHVSHANDIITAETGNASLKFDFYISMLATFLIVQTIAALCLESQARDLSIIKTCGASQKATRRTLLGEVSAVTLAGFGFGALLALPVINPYTTWAIGVMTDASGRTFGLDAGSFLMAALALAIAVYFGSRSTIKRVSRQNVVSAMQGETDFSRKRKRIVAGIITTLAIVLNIAIIVTAFFSNQIITFLRSLVETGMGDNPEAAKMVASAEGGLILMSPMLFVVGIMILSGTLAPRLYRSILGWTARRIPASAPGWLEVGIKQAAYNAGKYYGSITPLVIFMLAIVMVFSAIDSALAPITTLYRQHGVSVADVSGTNYDAVIIIIGPALFIAFVGSLANIIMSGRSRIYTNKLTAILGIKGRTQLLQALTETAGYAYVAAVIGLVAMLLASGLVWVAGSTITHETQPYILSWTSYFLALVFIVVVISIPAFNSVIRSRKLPSRQVLESFGE